MAKDIYHDVVKTALEKDGWTVTHNPYTIPKNILGGKLEIDLGLEKIITAEKGIEKIAVEVKCFFKASIVNEFHSVVGQYYNYLVGLERVEPERILYLAIPEEAYSELKDMELFNIVVEKMGIKLIVFIPLQEQITLWKK